MSDRSVVLDASALLCVLFREPGGETVETMLTGARMSAVNYSEVIAKLVDRGVALDDVLQDLAELDIEIVDLDREQAIAAGRMRSATRSAGLSLGDRACLSLAFQIGATAVTADRAWAGLEIGVAIEVVR